MAKCTLELYETEFGDRHLLHGALAWWAARKPHSAAFINHDRGQSIDWRTFDAATTGLARQLLRLGFRKGDFLAASLPFLTGHILLEYACFKIGVIHAPLDLRLKPPEVIRCLSLLGAKGYAFPGVFRGIDFGELGRAVKVYDRVWVILSHFRDREGLIVKTLAKNYRLVYQHNFHRVEVYLFEKQDWKEHHTGHRKEGERRRLLDPPAERGLSG